MRGVYCFVLHVCGGGGGRGEWSLVFALRGVGRMRGDVGPVLLLLQGPEWLLGGCSYSVWRGGKVSGVRCSCHFRCRCLHYPQPRLLSLLSPPAPLLLSLLLYGTVPPLIVAADSCKSTPTPPHKRCRTPSCVHPHPTLWTSWQAPCCLQARMLMGAFIGLRCFPPMHVYVGHVLAVSGASLHRLLCAMRAGRCVLQCA